MAKTFEIILTKLFSRLIGRRLRAVDTTVFFGIRQIQLVFMSSKLSVPEKKLDVTP